MLGDVLNATRFWETYRDVAMTNRQRLVLLRVLEGFEGKLTTQKWAKFGKTSLDTALREITDLLEKGVLVKNPGGSRTTSYDLAPIGERADTLAERTATISNARSMIGPKTGGP